MAPLDDDDNHEPMPTVPDVAMNKVHDPEGGAASLGLVQFLERDESEQCGADQEEGIHAREGVCHSCEGWGAGEGTVGSEEILGSRLAFYWV